MSRYVEKKHGLTIGSDNNFFYKDEKGIYHDFPCILSVSGYQFDNSMGYYYRIHTPAEQILVHHRIMRKGEYIDEYGEDRVGRIGIEPSKWLKNWLDKNAPGWGCPPIRPRENLTIFFQKRKHALALCKEVDKILEGIPCAKKYL